jgi:muconolactone delta-isomerase
MPLRVWRSDEATPLSPHPNDPAQQAEKPTSPAAAVEGGEFLTTFTATVPSGTPDQVFEDAEVREAQRARELAGHGHLLRLWALPGQGRALGLWRAHDAAALKAILASLPLPG